VVTQTERSAAATLAILEAADTLFGHDGFLATSVKRIADKAGVSKSGLLHHFGSKEEIFRQVFIRAEQQLVEQSLHGTANATPKQQLERGARNLLDALQNPRLRQIVLIDGPAVLGWAQWRRIEAEYGISIIIAVLEEAARAGNLAVTPSASVAGILLAALHEASFALVDEPAARTDIKHTLQQIIDALFLDVPAKPKPKKTPAKEPTRAQTRTRDTPLKRHK
jgi:AcrR family transcriptional regulator